MPRDPLLTAHCSFNAVHLPNRSCRSTQLSVYSVVGPLSCRSTQLSVHSVVGPLSCRSTQLWWLQELFGWQFWYTARRGSQEAQRAHGRYARDPSDGQLIRSLKALTTKLCIIQEDTDRSPSRSPGKKAPKKHPAGPPAEGGKLGGRKECGTPGCKLAAWHNGPCDTMHVDGPRQRHSSAPVTLAEVFSPPVNRPASGGIPPRSAISSAALANRSESAPGGDVNARLRVPVLGNAERARRERCMWMAESGRAMYVGEWQRAIYVDGSEW